MNGSMCPITGKQFGEDEARVKIAGPGKKEWLVSADGLWSKTGYPSPTEGNYGLGGIHLTDPWQAEENGVYVVIDLKQADIRLMDRLCRAIQLPEFRSTCGTIILKRGHC